MWEIEKLKEYADVYGKAEAVMDAIAAKLRKEPEEAGKMEREMIRVIQETPRRDEYFIFYLSALIQLFPRAEYVELLLDAVSSSGQLSLQSRDYIWHNLNNYLIKHPQCESADVQRKMLELLDGIEQHVRSMVSVSRKEKAERNSARVIVMIRTFLGESHAPSHSALERCKMLQQMGMEVYLVATKEGNYTEPTTPYYMGGLVQYVREFDGRAMCPYGDHSFYFYQEPIPVICKEGMQDLISFVEEVNPYFILYIDVESYVANILNDICPVAAMSVTFSKLRNYRTAFAITGRSVSEAEKRAHSYQLLEIPFTFELKEQKRKYTRAELKIPENVFVLAVVGLRLAYDVTEEFLAYMKQLRDIHVLFIGIYDGYEEICSRDEWLNAHSTCTGQVDEVIGRLSCADLYVNPRRLGGGFSVIEAFHAGIPAVTIAYGDVAAAAGSAFCVSDYPEMIRQIERYQRDNAYYQKMLACGRKREQEMTDGQAVFEKGIRQMLDSREFF